MADSQENSRPKISRELKNWVTKGVGRDEIANRLEVTFPVGDLLEIRGQLAEKRFGQRQWRDPATRCGSTLCRAYSAGGSCRPSKVHALLQIQNGQAAFDLPLSQNLIEQLALEASVRGRTLADIIGKIVRQVMEKGLLFISC